VYAKTARNLISKSWFGTNDPYLKMWTNTTRSTPQQSNSHKDGGNAALWRENFELTVRDAMTEFLYMEVVNDKNQKLIGRVRILCAEIPDGDGVESWFKIYDDKGKLGGELQVTLKRSQDESSDGTINRFILLSRRPYAGRTLLNSPYTASPILTPSLPPSDDIYYQTWAWYGIVLAEEPNSSYQFCPRCGRLRSQSPCPRGSAADTGRPECQCGGK
jgi:hypothetical protein